MAPARSSGPPVPVVGRGAGLCPLRLLDIFNKTPHTLKSVQVLASQLKADKLRCNAQALCVLPIPHLSTYTTKTDNRRSRSSRPCHLPPTVTAYFYETQWSPFTPSTLLEEVVGPTTLSSTTK
eukprot:4116505-Pyramimonas_sp.AAC.4